MEKHQNMAGFQASMADKPIGGVEVNSSISSVMMRRLAFAKHLYGLALRQSRLSGQTASASVLLFHDAVDLFAQAAADHLGMARKSNAQFLDYWDTVPSLPKKNEMMKLNTLRKNLKHHGVHPSPSDLEEMRVHVREFLDVAAETIFGLSFSAITLIELVQPGAARDALTEAVDFLERGDTKKAIERIAVAHMELLELTEIEIVSPGFMPRVETSEGREIVKWAEAKLMALRESVFFLHYDLDPRDFRLLRKLAPSIVRTFSGNLQIRDHGGRAPTEEEVQRCLDFVMESAIRVADYRSGFPFEST